MHAGGGLPNIHSLKNMLSHADYAFYLAAIFSPLFNISQQFYKSEKVLYMEINV